MVHQTPAERMCTLIETLDLIAHARGLRSLSSPDFCVSMVEHDRSRIDAVFRHLNAHYTEPIDQAEVARLIHMTPAAFCRFFKRMSGRTLTDYVHELRVGRACRLLEETDRPITEVCFDAGFTNGSNFNRVFLRRRGMSPRAFRKRAE